MICISLTVLLVGLAAAEYHVSDFQGKVFKLSSMSSNIYPIDVGLAGF